MENNCKMIELKQEEEIELDLGLSIGCSFKNSEKLNSIKNEPVQYSQHRMDPMTSDFDVDPQVKREIEALRRQEAKRKRQEKQQKKINGDNKMWLKSPDLETEHGEFDAKKEECKRSRVEDNKAEMQNVNLNFTMEQNINLNKSSTFGCNQKGYSSTLYPYPAIHYVPFTNGLQYPCLNMMPCLASCGAAGLLEESGLNACVSDQNRKSGSNGSPVCSSSLVSDYRSSSHDGGGGSDARSHSSHSLPEQNPLHGSRANDSIDQSEHSASSQSREAARAYEKTTNCIENSIKRQIHSDTAQFIPITKCTTNSVDQQMIPSYTVQFNSTKTKEEVAIETQPVSSESQVSTTVNPSLKESKKDTGKPPKPQSQNINTPCFQHMPCVSTTGNGPNGKTINGFLYRYTKTELSIICVCHGTSFSPAEFVQHAGGTDVSHPLRHITVIPSNF